MTLYVKIRPGGWSVVEEYYKTGKRYSRTVPRLSYPSLGISESFTIVEAKTRVREINSRKHTLDRPKINSAENFKRLKLIQSVYLPESKVREFITSLFGNSFGSDAHKKRLISHWQYVSKMIVKLELEPVEYFKNRKLIYDYFINGSLSLDYVNKLLRVLNSWGEFICQSQGQFYKPVPRPLSNARSSIVDAYLNSNKPSKESKPITPEMVESIHGKVPEVNYNWLKLSVWFGLRPSEIDSLHNPKNYRVSHGKTPVLWVYQAKLKAINREDRWKGIPCFLPEQCQALTLLNKGFKRPLVKTLKRVLGEGYTTYGGRKGFYKLMKGYGQKFENISKWLGHKSLDRTYKDYYDDDPSFDPVA